MNYRSDTIDEIEQIRSRNNGLWMEILRVALDTAPERTKKLIHAINENDRAISAFLEELSKA